MKALLTRLADTAFGVFGRLELVDGDTVHRFWTCEDDWLQNAPGESCIPAGIYECRWGTFPKHGRAVEVTGVPGRSAILFHSGNTEEDTRGCLLLGNRLGTLDVPDEDEPTKPVGQKFAVVDSKAALAAFDALVAEFLSFPLEIRWDLPHHRAPVGA